MAVGEVADYKEQIYQFKIQFNMSIKLSNTNENGNCANRVLCAGDRYPHRYWECECCGQLITTFKQDDATKYQCPACKISECEHGGKFVEITLQDFCENANIACT